MTDDALHELQLSGKQLVFLFMAATVVATVIFLSGVMVGRGVRAERGEVAAAPETDADPTAAAVPPLPAPVGGASGTSAATRESLTYPDRLAADAPSPEVLKEPEPNAVEPSYSPPSSASGAKPAAKAASEKPAAPVAPGDSGFTVQVAAIKERDEAQRIAKRLIAKGFPAYVTAPANDAAKFFRVRVGKFQDRGEADAMARRLENEEQFKPWVTR
jgi:cell division septation protein DedD